MQGAGQDPGTHMPLALVLVQLHVALHLHHLEKPSLGSAWTGPLPEQAFGIPAETLEFFSQLLPWLTGEVQ